MENKNIFEIKHILKNIFSSSSRTTRGSNLKQKNINLYFKDSIIRNKSIEILENCQGSKDIKNNIIKEKSHNKYINIKKNKYLSKEIPHNKLFNSFYNDYYSGMILNKAPTLSYNKKSISQLINKKRNNKINIFDNFYNNSLLSKLNTFRNSKYISDKIKNKRSIIDSNNKSSDNISLNTFNMSSDEGFINFSSNNNSSILDKNTSKEEKTNIRNIKNIKDIKKNLPFLIHKNNISLLKNKSNDNKYSKRSKSLKTNESKDYLNKTSKNVLMTMLPNIQFSQRNKKSKGLSCFSTFGTNHSNEISLFNFEIKKIKSYIYETINNKSNTPQQFTSLENRIAKIKYYQKIQENNLQKLLKTDKFNLQKKLDYLKGLKDIYNNLWEKYSKDINIYLIYLFDKNKKIQKDLENDVKQKRLIEYKIEKLIIQTVKKQNELERLVDLRNFLLQVKLNLSKQPPYFKALLLRDSRKIELGNIILNSTVGTKNSDVIDFLDSFSFLNLVKTYEVNPSFSANSLINKNKRYSKKLFGYNLLPKEFKQKYVYKDNLLNDKNIYIPKKGEIIFNSSSKFIEIIEKLEEKNIYLINEINILKKSSALYNQEFQKALLNKEEDDKIENKLNLEIIEKIKILNKIKDKYKILETKFNTLNNIDFNENNNYTKKLVKIKSKSSFVDINFFRMVDYLNELKEYKYTGLLLLEKLIRFIKNFFSYKLDYDIKRSYNIVGAVRFNNILSLNKKSFNEKNKFMIYDYSLKLLTIYEDICIYIINKHSLYELNIKNKNFMHKKWEEQQNLKKIINAREMRHLLEKKRQNEIKKLLDKWSFPINNIQRKVSENINFKINRNKRNKSIGEIEKQKRDIIKEEFNDLTFFH